MSFSSNPRLDVLNICLPDFWNFTFLNSDYTCIWFTARQVCKNPLAQLAVLLAICQWDMSRPTLSPAILLWKLKVPVIKKCFKITHSELKDKPRRLMSSHTDKNCPLCKTSSKAFSWMKIFVFWQKFHWSLFLIVIDNKTALALIQVMAGCC